MTLMVAKHDTPGGGGIGRAAADRRAVANAEALAVALCHLYGGTCWRAELRGWSARTAAAGNRRQVAVAVDRRRLVVLTHWHLGPRTDRWMITVDGRPIPYRPPLGEFPGAPAAVAYGVRRHLAGDDPAICDGVVGCDAPGVVATYGRSVCLLHTSHTLYRDGVMC
jgi:hypothetical protein